MAPSKRAAAKRAAVNRSEKKRAAAKQPALKRTPAEPSPSVGPNPEIELLIERCLRGDEAAWDVIVRTYRRKVFNTAYKFVGRHEEAEDLTQEIFIKLYRSLRTFDRRANFQTWLISISRNLCIDRYRQKRKERETIDTNIDADELRPVSQELHPLFRVEQRDRVELLRAALATLPESLREPLIMHDLQELGYAQIAKTLRMPEGTAKSRINRARGELAAAIRKLRGDDYKPSEASTPSDTARLPGAFK